MGWKFVVVFFLIPMVRTKFHAEYPINIRVISYGVFAVQSIRSI